MPPTIADSRSRKLIDLYAWLYTSLSRRPDWDRIIPVDGAYAAIKTVGIPTSCASGALYIPSTGDGFGPVRAAGSDRPARAVHPGFS